MESVSGERVTVKTLILGLGNPILSDDGVGVHVARALAKVLPQTSQLSIAEASVGGLRLLELIYGYQRVILADAIQTKGGRAGDVYRLEPGNFCATLHSGCSHDIDLFTALELGRKLGMPMPEEIVIIAIEVNDVTTFGETCTPDVEAAIPKAVEMILATL